jgi:endonuclease VIII
MPEGPSLVIAVEELEKFRGKTIAQVSGNSKQPIVTLTNQKILEIFSFGKYLNFQFKKFGFRIHFMLWGRYSINEEREGKPIRLFIGTKKDKAYFYNCSIKFFEDTDLRSLYDFRIDIMSPLWDKKFVLAKVKACKEERVDDVLMDQTIFAGVGNIIKNEVMYRQKLLPSHLIKDLKPKQLDALVQDARDYSQLFYEWKKQYVLRKHYTIYRQGKDLLEHKVIHEKTGHRQRMSHYCTICQK